MWLRSISENSIQIPVHILIGYANYFPASLDHECVSAAVVCDFCVTRMRCSIHFQHKLYGNTGKIGDVGPYGVLTAEMHAMHLLKPQA